MKSTLNLKNQKLLPFIGGVAFLFLLAGIVFFRNQKTYESSFEVTFGANLRSAIKACGCEFLSYGGAANRFTYLKQVLTKNPQTLIFDSGNYFTSSDQIITDKKLIKKAELNKLLFEKYFASLYTAMNVGSFDKGLGEGLLEKFNQKFVTSKNSILKTLNSGTDSQLKIQIIGVSHTELPANRDQLLAILSKIPEDTLPILLSEATYGETKLLGSQYKRPLLVLGDHNLGVACSAQAFDNLVIATGTDMGRHYCELQLKVSQTRESIKSLSLVSKIEVPMSFKFEDDKSPILKLISDWEKENFEIVEGSH